MAMHSLYNHSSLPVEMPSLTILAASESENPRAIRYAKVDVVDCPPVLDDWPATADVTV